MTEAQKLIRKRPFVLGYPRSGLSLLTTICNELIAESDYKVHKSNSNMALYNEIGENLSKSILTFFEDKKFKNNTLRLIYNDNFKELLGGPKWLNNLEEHISIRKYIGIENFGDFTLIINLPIKTMDYYDVFHTHNIPTDRFMDKTKNKYEFMASFRQPVDVISSACFSINALASDYIQHNNLELSEAEIRYKLALNKLSSPLFFEALVEPYKKYLNDFCASSGKFKVVLWENIIERPYQTIFDLSETLELCLSKKTCKKVYDRLRYRNLTGAHLHNFDYTSAKRDRWKTALTNSHIEMLKDYGFDDYNDHWGYPKLSYTKPSDYSNFQKKLERSMRNGVVIDELTDRQLYGYAFNKSNLDFSKFNFLTFEPKKYSHIEKTDIFELKDLLTEFGKFIETEVEKAYYKLQILDWGVKEVNPTNLPKLSSKTISSQTKVSNEMTKVNSIPHIVYETDDFNVVSFEKIFYLVEKKLGAIKFPVQPNSYAFKEYTNIFDSIRAAYQSENHNRVRFLARNNKSFLNEISKYLGLIKKKDLTLFVIGKSKLSKSIKEEMKKLGIKFTENEALIKGLNFENSLLVCCDKFSGQDTETIEALATITNVTFLTSKTKNYFKQKRLFLVSVPKSGTHLLFKFASALGFKDGRWRNNNQIEKGEWGFLDNANSHTNPLSFFEHAVSIANFGNREHLFPSNPTMFIYRSPWDLLLSEAEYYGKPGKTIFSGALMFLNLVQKMKFLLSGNNALSPFGVRIKSYLGWFNFPNVLPVSYEALVGAVGSGSSRVKLELIWKTMLKLEVDGDVPDVAALLYDVESATFNVGKAFRHTTETSFASLTEEEIETIGDLSVSFGYKSKPDSNTISVRSYLDQKYYLQDEQIIDPVLYHSNFFKYNIAKYKGYFYAIPFGQKETCWAKSKEEFLKSKNIEELKFMIYHVVHNEN